MFKKLIDLDLLLNIEIGQKYTQFEIHFNIYQWNKSRPNSELTNCRGFCIRFSLQSEHFHILTICGEYRKSSIVSTSGFRFLHQLIATV